LEVGKVADFVVLSNDLLKCADDEILKTEVISTYIAGTQKFKSK